MTRPKAISWVYGNLALTTNHKVAMDLVVEHINSLPDDLFDPEDPVNDAINSVAILSRLEMIDGADSHVVAQVAAAKAARLMEEYWPED